jgi:putative transcriptional regulator
VQGAVPDVAALRARFRLSQPKFAALLGINVSTLQNWEQKRRQPEGPARVLLRVAAAHPEAILSVTTAPRAGRRKRAASV